MKQNIEVQSGSLLYLAICTRPDILYAVSIASRKSSKPTLEDWSNVLKIYLGI